MKRKANGQPAKQPAAKKVAKKTLFNPSPRKPLSVELKNFDTNNTITPLAGVGTWQIQNLNTFGQGVTSSDRVGRKITMKKISLRWFISATGAAGSGGCGRFKIVYDKQTNGAQPAVTDIFAINNGLSHNNLFNSERFITIFDSLTPSLAVNDLANSRGQENFKKTMNLDTMYLSGGTGIADVGTGGLFILYSQQVQSAASINTFSYSCRIRYTDV